MPAATSQPAVAVAAAWAATSRSADPHNHRPAGAAGIHRRDAAAGADIPLRAAAGVAGARRRDAGAAVGIRPVEAAAGDSFQGAVAVDRTSDAFP